MTDDELRQLLANAGTQFSAGGSSQQSTTGELNGVPSSGGAGGGPVGVPAGTNLMEYYLRSIPGYQFAFTEGQRAAQTGAASRGTLLTGRTLKALARFGTGLADQTYGNQVNRFLSLADIGARTATAPF